MIAGSGPISETQPPKEMRALLSDTQSDNKQILVLQAGRTGQCNRLLQRQT